MALLRTPPRALPRILSEPKISRVMSHPSHTWLAPTPAALSTTSLARLSQITRQFSTSPVMASTKNSNRKLCMIPGPVEFHEDVLEAMSTPATSHVSADFIPVFGESIELLRKVVLTENGQPFVVSGSGTLGWDMMCNLFEAGDNVLVLNTGYFGDKFGECLEVYGANVTYLKAAIGDRPSLEQVRQALSAKKYKLITITHVDTSTGVLSDVKGVAHLVREVSPDTLIIVDGVCSVGSEELRFDEWCIDVVLTASQKALGTPSGLAILVVSQKALKIYHERKTPVPSYYASWKKWLPIMNAYESRKGAYFATPAVQLIYALNTSLKQILTTTMDERFAAHQRVSLHFKKAVAAKGLRQLPKGDATAANGMTAVYCPEGILAGQVVGEMVKHGVQIAGGLHEQIATKYFRVGHMGISVMEPNRNHIDSVIAALENSLKTLGYRH